MSVRLKIQTLDDGPLCLLAPSERDPFLHLHLATDGSQQESPVLGEATVALPPMGQAAVVVSGPEGLRFSPDAMHGPSLCIDVLCKTRLDVANGPAALHYWRGTRLGGAVVHFGAWYSAWENRRPLAVTLRDGSRITRGYLPRLYLSLEVEEVRLPTGHQHWRGLLVQERFIGAAHERHAKEMLRRFYHFYNNPSGPRPIVPDAARSLVPVYSCPGLKLPACAFVLHQAAEPMTEKEMDSLLEVALRLNGWSPKKFKDAVRRRFGASSPAAAEEPRETDTIKVLSIIAEATTVRANAMDYLPDHSGTEASERFMYPRVARKNGGDCEDLTIEICIAFFEFLLLCLTSWPSLVIADIRTRLSAPSTPLCFYATQFLQL